jgi:molybdate transport system ATP-binding protein
MNESHYNSGNDVIRLRYKLQRDAFGLDVSLELPMRGITGIFGTSGAGKTTLLRCIAGLEQATDAELVVAGEVWEDRATNISRAIHERDIGYVFQEPRLFRHLDVRRNLEYGRRTQSGAEGAVGFEEAVDLLGLEKLLHRMPDALSGGEAQRVAIARALIRAPRFVLMDEPLAGLDQSRRNSILPFLDRLHAELAVPIIYVSHSIEEVCRLCDYLVVIDDGRVAAEGELQSVLVGMAVPVLVGEEAGSVISATVDRYDGDDDLTRLVFSGGELWVPGDPGQSNSQVRLRVRANDVSLCRDRPERTSILNILPVIVDAMESGRGASILVRLSLGKDKVLARVTRRSLRELGIREGDEVLAQIKSVAVRHAHPA